MAEFFSQAEYDLVLHTVQNLGEMIVQDFVSSRESTDLHAKVKPMLRQLLLLQAELLQDDLRDEPTSESWAQLDAIDKLLGKLA